MKKKFSRRTFIKSVGLGIAGAATIRSPMAISSLATESDAIDIMIIGSGFGGAVAALRLAELGIHTVMLERGRRWPITKEQNTFSSLQNPDGRSAWLSDVAILGEPKAIDKYIGVLELTLGNGIAALAGAGVGGGSLIYAGALYQPSRHLFEKSLGNNVDYHEMDSIYYPRVKSILRPRPIPIDILKKREYAAARMWWKLGRNAGLRTKLVEHGISWDVVKKELEGELKPSVIAGDFWYGNNSGAKRSLDRNYLQQAEEQGHLEILTQQNVTSIQEGPDGRYLVTSDEIDANGTLLARRKYVVKKLILSAGSLGTSKLLTRAKGRDWLPKLNDEVGKNWGNNGDFFSSLSGLRKKIKPNLGGMVPVAIEDHHNPILPTTIECYADWSQAGQQGLISSIGMSTPPAKGMFVYNKTTDDVVLTWPGGDPDISKTIAAGAATYNKLASSWGLGEHVHPVRSGHCEIHSHRRKQYSSPETSPVSANVTAHPLGGVVLDRATDNIGKLKNYNGLYVMDGALIPGHTGCTNPALTIAALAERNIERIIERDF